MEKIIIYIVFILFVLGCKNNNTGLDTMVINNSVTLIVRPTIQQYEELKQELGEEDYYVTMDDANFYLNSADKILEKYRSKVIHSTAKKQYIFPYEKHTISHDSLHKTWYIIDYKKGALPKVYLPIDILNTNEFVQKDSHTIGNTKSDQRHNFFLDSIATLKIDTSWIGDYRVGLSSYNDTYSYGYFIEIRKDSSIVKSKNSRDLIVPLERGDTLLLYHKKSYSNTYSNSVEEPEVKLYRIGKEYYIESQLFADREISDIPTKFGFKMYKN